MQEGKATGVCDPLDATCEEDDRVIYARDVDRMYCGDDVVECACSREYLHCMIKAGCANDGEPSKDEYVEQCILAGCSAKQCGLAPGTDVCHVSTPVCANNYFRCNAQSEDHCGCTKEFISCRTSSGCLLDDKIDQLSGFNAFDLCVAEGCSAAACGLPDNSERCNQTSLQCSDHYLGCLSGEAAFIAFFDEDAGSSDYKVNPVISQDQLAVTWAAMQDLDSAGAALASRGVHSGKYYWEVKVPGVCAVVGVAQEGFLKYTYPGYDDNSWGYGDFGFGGELFHDYAETFGASITDPAVCSMMARARSLGGLGAVPVSRVSCVPRVSGVSLVCVWCVSISSGLSRVPVPTSSCLQCRLCLDASSRWCHVQRAGLMLRSACATGDWRGAGR